MKKLFQASLPLLLPGLLFIASCNKSQNQANTDENKPPVQLADSGEKTLSAEELISKGEHLIITSGCEDCHSPKKYKNGIPESDMERRLSGHPADLKLAPYDAKTVKNGWSMTNQHFTAWVGPWGTSFSANITSDKETGIGTWTEEQFVRCIREGKYHGLADGRMMLPPMPWPDFKHFTDEELRAIFTFLKSTPAIKNPVPAPIPPKGA